MFINSPREIDVFLCILPFTMLRMLAWLVFNDSNAFATTTLLAAVLSDHVQLPDTVLNTIRIINTASLA